MSQRSCLVTEPRWWASIVALVLLLTSGRVHAEQNLTWRAPAGCPGSALVAARLRELLEEKGSAQHVSVDITVDTAPTGQLRARIQGHDGSAQRELYADGCEALVEGVLLVLALSFAEPAAPALLQESPAQGVAPPPPAAPAATLIGPQPGAEVPEPASRPIAASAFSTGILTRLDTGSLPDPSAGIGGLVGLTRARLRIELEAAHYFSQAQRLPRDASGHLRVRLTTGIARACYAPRDEPLNNRHRLGWAGCLAGELGAMRAHSAGLVGVKSRRSLTAALWLGLTGSLATRSMLRPWLSVELGLSVLRPSFDAEGYGTLFRPSRVGARGTFGVAALFR